MAIPTKRVPHRVADEAGEHAVQVLGRTSRSRGDVRCSHITIGLNPASSWMLAHRQLLERQRGIPDRQGRRRKQGGTPAQQRQDRAAENRPPGEKSGSEANRMPDFEVVIRQPSGYATDPFPACNEVRVLLSACLPCAPCLSASVSVRTFEGVFQDGAILGIDAHLMRDAGVFDVEGVAKPFSCSRRLPAAAEDSAPV